MLYNFIVVNDNTPYNSNDMYININILNSIEGDNNTVELLFSALVEPQKCEVHKIIEVSGYLLCRVTNSDVYSIEVFCIIVQYMPIM